MPGVLSHNVYSALSTLHTMLDTVALNCLFFFFLILHFESTFPCLDI